MSFTEKNRKTNRDGSTNNMNPVKGKKSNFDIVAGWVLSYMAALLTVYGMLEFSRPDLINLALDNISASLALFVGLGIGLISLFMSIGSLGSATFERAVRLGRQTVQYKMDEFKEESFSYGTCSSNTDFEGFISNILKSLSAYATSSEETAAKLLDKGVAFMAGGLVFYVLAIAIWQLFANLTKPDPHVMYVGMAACSMTFIVIEFLAAWFFKQYRYYVEVSLSCLRVRSVYDRYLLNYYALREFNLDSDVSVREQLLEVLKEDVNWPTYKGGAANDFNYMVESMGAAHTSMEKMKDIFQPKKKSKSKPKKS